MQGLASDISTITKLAAELGCRVETDAELKKFTTFKIGGKCKVLISINNAVSAGRLFSFAHEHNMPFLVLGKGSNMLISDDGFDGVVFFIGKDFCEIKLVDENTIEATAGVPLARVAYFAYENSLTGFEFAWGIPGNVGGAVFMNAGAYGGEIKDIIISAECVDEKGMLHNVTSDGLDLGYRHSIFSKNGWLITKAAFRLEKGNKEKIKSRMDELMHRRKDKQPLEFGSAGSTFKRPEGSYAALLIEQCGLKGTHVGDAEVSVKHSGFVINKGNASFKDVVELIRIVRETVLEKTGYQLECEVRIVE